MFCSVRTILSTRYKGTLATFATSFTDLKHDLESLITEKSAVTVTAEKDTLNGMSKKVDSIVEFLNAKSPGEQEVEDVVERLGGAAAVIGVSQYGRRPVFDAHRFLVPSRTKNF